YDFAGHYGLACIKLSIREFLVSGAWNLWLSFKQQIIESISALSSLNHDNCEAL
ncbi:hypothetical protein NPIL_290111, partial [Nephila pilipes]